MSVRLFTRRFPVTIVAASLALPASALLASAARATAPPLIPRAVLFGLPSRADASISPDGARLSFLAPVDGVMNIWHAPAGRLGEAKPLTKVRDRDITNHFWSYDNKHILYVQDTDGDENDHFFSVDTASGERKDLTPVEGADAYLVGASAKHPDEILLGMNDRHPKYYDVYRVSLQTGERRLVLKNTKYRSMLADDDLKLRMGQTNEGWEEMKLAKGSFAKGSFARGSFAKGSFAMETVPSFDASNKYLYVLTQVGRDKTALVRLKLENGEEKAVASGVDADVSGVLVNPATRAIEAVWEEHAARRWQAIDEKVGEDLGHLVRIQPGAFMVTGQTMDGRKWIVAYDRDDGPASYYLYDRDTKKAELLFANRPELEGLPLARMHALSIPARDGLPLVSYLTLPVDADADGDGRPEKPLPMVLWIHGGPAARDSWGYDPVHQWLANRGYAVLSVNYRGSAGFGKAFQEAGNRQWGGKMQADINDAMDWAVKEGIADPAKVALTGASYGGYAALVGLTSAPERFACGVDMFGPSNLVTMYESDRARYFDIDLDDFRREIGDVKSKRGKEFLLSRSPLTKAGQLKRPLLVAQGANDPRVVKQESDQFVEAVSHLPVPVTYLFYPDEGHGFQKTANNASFHAVMEAFLAKHLGGRAEPFGEEMRGSTLQVLRGQEHIPGLAEALAAAAKDKAGAAAAPAP